MRKILLFLAIAFLALSYKEKIKYLEKQVEDPAQNLIYKQEQLWFDQIIDHFDYSSSKKFSQRYYVVDAYFNPKVGPIFLYICGEYTCNGVPEARQWVILMAQRLQGMVITLQHRYYGRSLPFGYESYTLENLKYLSSEQALKDLAYFTQQIVSQKLHKVANNPWIAVGGSYPGAVSAWYRYKYPHMTVGAIASSAVINAIVDFKEFDEQMYLSANKSGQYCYKAINDSSINVQSILNSADGAAFKAQFVGADKLTDNEFLFFWIDSIVQKIQYGSRTTLCDSLKGKSAQDQLKIFINIVKTNDVHEYGGYYLKNSTYYAEKTDSSRAWMYQCCTEYGWWQTFSDVHSLRSKRVDINFYRQFCKDAFGVALWPDVDRKNTEYGALDLKAFNLLMSNGDEDPWKWASLLQPKGNIISRVANCTNCAHCVDLYTPSINDAVELKKIRDEQYLTISGWIEEYWRNSTKLQKTNKQLTEE